MGLPTRHSGASANFSVEDYNAPQPREVRLVLSEVKSTTTMSLERQYSNLTLREDQPDRKTFNAAQR
ncbi:MAG: hypothetical protein ACLUNZ_11775 [Evtepia sp.]